MLTDNEKVATFIYWKANCPEHLGYDHCSKAPNMLKSENLSNVIEELVHKLYKISFYEGDYDDRDHCICDIETWFQVSLPKEWRQKHIIGQSTKSLIDAFISAVTKLYDIEHLPQNNEEIF